MIQLILERYSGDPYWVAAAGVILLIILFLFLASLIRNFKKLIWYYIAAILIALVFSAYLSWYPMLLEALVAYRSDWSLVFLMENTSFSNLLTQFVFYVIIYSVLAILIVVAVDLLSLLSFRWKRVKIILERSFSMSWFVLLFALLNILASYITRIFFDDLSFQVLIYLFEFFAFVFTIQFTVRLLDSARLKTANAWLEYSYSLGLVLILFHLSLDWLGTLLPRSAVLFLPLASGDFLVEGQFLAREMFFDHLFTFFLVILSLGFLCTFFVRALFVSDSFVGRYRQKMPSYVFWLSRFLFTREENTYSGSRIILGILLSLGSALLMIILLLKAMYLVLIPVFFLEYFLLFYLLDHQHDMMVKGELLEKR